MKLFRKSDSIGAIERELAIEYIHLYARHDNQWIFVSNRTTQLVEQSHPCP
jgi:hypothetical protein